MRKFFLFIASITAFCSLLALGYTEFFYSPPISFNGQLKNVIPQQWDGWKVEDKPLASTEAQVEIAEGILDLSDFVNREYTRGSLNIHVYVAYWKPKTKAVRHVQSHTPDVCWVRNGWTLEADESQFSVSRSIEGKPLFPAEMRTLTADENYTQHVAYWHVIGDEIYVNRTKAGQWDRWDPIKTLMKYGLHQQKEQFFVRINSNQPIDQIWDLPLMQEILRDLADLTLAPKSAPATSSQSAEA